jgi:ketosteroid isomerase-like protein
MFRLRSHIRRSCTLIHMRSPKLIRIAAALLLLLSPCLAQSEQEKAQIEVDVLAVMARQSAAWNRGDIAGYMDGYWRSPDLVFASGDQITRGWQPTLDRYKKSYDTKAKMGQLTFSDIDVNVLSKDVAVVLGSWSLAREKDNPKGKFTVIFRRLKEGWRIIHDHTS